MRLHVAVGVSDQRRRLLALSSRLVSKRSSSIVSLRGECNRASVYQGGACTPPPRTCLALLEFYALLAVVGSEPVGGRARVVSSSEVQWLPSILDMVAETVTQKVSQIRRALGSIGLWHRMEPSLSSGDVWWGVLDLTGP